VSDLPITLADFAIIAAVIISGLLAFFRGFVHEVLAVAGWIGAIFAVIFGLPLVRPLTRQWIADPLVADIAGGTAIFLVTIIMLSLITRSISKQVRGSMLSPIDRSLGFLFGVARGAVLVSLLYIGVEWLLPAEDQPAWIRDAKMLPLIQTGARQLKNLAGVDGSEAATGDSARERARKALETREMVRDMMSPEPKGPPSGGQRASEGYDSKERQQLERLLDSNR
jgi:membrane protein required for colicin V production